MKSVVSEEPTLPNGLAIKKVCGCVIWLFASGSPTGLFFCKAEASPSGVARQKRAGTRPAKNSRFLKTARRMRVAKSGAGIARINPMSMRTA